jgi:phage gpG-like protein
VVPNNLKVRKMARNISQLPGDLHHFSSKLKDKIAEILPVIVAAEGQAHFEASWDNQGFTDKSLSKWKKRKAPRQFTKRDHRETAAYKGFKHKDAGRAILVSHGTDTKGTHLKDSIRTDANTSRVIFATDKPYAQVHNEGGRSGRGSGFIMVKRQFMGASEKLDQKIEKKLTKEITKFFESLK